MSLEGRQQGPLEWETDRARFLGRGRSPADPMALDGRALSGTTGIVLDPIVSLRQRIRLPAGAIVRLNFATGMASDRETAEALARKYHGPEAATRAFALAMTHVQSGLRHLGISADDAVLFERLASRVLGTDSSLRASAETMAANELGQPGLWPHAISGDLPILLVRVLGDEDLALVRQILQAQEYWRLKGLSADVVDPQRASRQLSRRDAGAAHRPAERRAVEHLAASARRRLPAAGGPHGPGRTRPARGRGAGHPSRRPGRPADPARTRPRGAAGGGPARAHGAADGRPAGWPTPPHRR